jgi:hypothetical protein
MGKVMAGRLPYLGPFVNGLATAPPSLRRTFISYHHADRRYKDDLLALNAVHGLFHDASVDVGDIDDTSLTEQQIREIIRDDYLRDSTVTVVLVGTGTHGRKHVDWEIYSSMFDGSVNKKSGIVVLMLPTTGQGFVNSAHGDDEKGLVFPEIASWSNVDTRQEQERCFPFVPARLVDNLLNPNARISVAEWSRIAANPTKLRTMIEFAHRDRVICDYDLSCRMR